MNNFVFSVPFALLISLASFATGGCSVKLDTVGTKEKLRPNSYNITSTSMDSLYYEGNLRVTMLLSAEVENEIYTIERQKTFFPMTKGAHEKTMEFFDDYMVISILLSPLFVMQYGLCVAFDTVSSPIWIFMDKETEILRDKRISTVNNFMMNNTILNGEFTVKHLESGIVFFNRKFSGEIKNNSIVINELKINNEGEYELQFNGYLVDGRRRTPLRLVDSFEVSESAL